MDDLNLQPVSFVDVIALWDNKALLADDCGVDYGIVNQWWRRNSIPAPYWETVIHSARKRNITCVTAELLTRLASKQGAIE